MQNNRRHKRAARQNTNRAANTPRLKAQKVFKPLFRESGQLTPGALLSGLMVMLIFFIPLLSGAQQNPAVAKAIADGELNARADASGIKWYLLGCIGGPFTIIAASAGNPVPPTEALLGKSPGYVEAYTKAYSSKVKSQRFRQATIGCFAGVTIGGLLWATYRYGFNRADEGGETIVVSWDDTVW